MRTAPLALVMILAAGAPCSAENLTPPRCRQIADAIAPVLSQFEQLDRAVRSLDTTGVAKAGKGRLQEAAEETASTQKEFLRASGAYHDGLAFLFNELKNCQNGVTLPRSEE